MQGFSFEDLPLARNELLWVVQYERVNTKSSLDEDELLVYMQDDG